MKIRNMLLLALPVLIASEASAQTCRTSLSTGMIVCDNGATGRTSTVTGITTFSDGRTARTSPVTGTTRFPDGTSFRTEPITIVSTPPDPKAMPTNPSSDATRLAQAATEAASPKARAAEWWLLHDPSYGSGGFATYVDRQSIRDDGKGRKTAWLSAHYATPRAGVSYRRTLERYDCAARTVDLVTMTTYASDARLLHTDEYREGDYAPLAVQPGTVGEASLRFVCSGLTGAGVRIEGTPEQSAEALFRSGPTGDR